MYPEEFLKELIERLKSDDIFYYNIMAMLNEKYETEEQEFIEYVDNRFPNCTLEYSDDLFLSWIKGTLKDTLLYQGFLDKKGESK